MVHIGHLYSAGYYNVVPSGHKKKEPQFYGWTKFGQKRLFCITLAHLKDSQKILGKYGGLAHKTGFSSSFCVTLDKFDLFETCVNMVTFVRTLL